MYVYMSHIESPKPCLDTVHLTLLGAFAAFASALGIAPGITIGFALALGGAFATALGALGSWEDSLQII